MSVFRKGFSLLEMSVVIIGVSLLLGGTIIAQNMVKEAKISRIFTDAMLVADATQQFKEKYNYLPGDSPNATSQLNAQYTISNGNGNGKLDAGTEQYQFLAQLYAAKLIKPELDGVTTPAYRINRKGVGNLYPTDFDYIGYLPEYITPTSTEGASMGVYLTLYKSTDGTSATTLAFPTEHTYALDNKFDDGNPTLGKFLAIDSSGSCYTGTTYNSSSTGNCGIKILIAPEQPAQANATLATCNGFVQGTTRESNARVCPQGTRGKFFQVCTSAGTWQESASSCTPIKCDNASPGTTRTVQCPFGWFGTMTETCTNSGLWVPTELFNSSPGSTFAPTSCTIDRASCPASGTIRYVGCPKGYSGYFQQACTNPNWGTSGNLCVNTRCTAPNAALINLGQTSTATTGSCPTGYTQLGASPSVSTCIIPTTNFRTSTTGTTVVTGHSCVLDYSAAGCANGATRILSCPMSERARDLGVQQTCNSAGYWGTTSNDCEPITCGGYPIGYIREAIGVKCPVAINNYDNGIGTPVEFCNASGVWTISNYNCY